MGKYDELFEEWEVRHARCFVLEYKAKFKALSREDFDDLLQECLIHWLMKKMIFPRESGHNEEMVLV